MKKKLQKNPGLSWPALIRNLRKNSGKAALGAGVLLAGWLSPGAVKAQTIINNYDFAASAGTFTPLPATATQVTAMKVDTYVMPEAPIGFTFNFDGVDYTNFRATSNGTFSFNSAATSVSGNNLSGSTAVVRPLLAPLWDDLDGRATGGSNASYQVTGTAGSRVFTFEWLNWEFNFGSTAPVISFQVKLYEGTNKIEFVYRPESGAVNNGSASVGIAGVGTGPGNFLSLSELSLTPTASYYTETTSINAKPASELLYSFTRVTPSALDVMTTALVAPVATTGCFPPTQSVIVTIKNNGTAPIDFSATPATVNASGTIGTTTTNFPAVTVNTGTLAPGATQNVTVTTNYQMALAGTYTFNATTTIAGDGRAVNNAMPAQTVTIAANQAVATATLPQAVDFTGFTGSNLATVFPGWTEASGAAPSPSGTTSNWTEDDYLNTTGTLNGSAARITLDAASDKVWIISPKVAITATTALKFDLALTTSGTTTPGTLGSDDQLQVMVSTDCGLTYTAIKTYSATTPISNTGQAENISLAAYAGQEIFVGLFATEGTVNDPESNDLFIDNIFLGTPPTLDLGATALVNPVAGSCFQAPEPVVVTINNFGPNAINFATTPATVTVNVTGAVTQTLTFVVNTGTLAAGASTNVTVANLNMTANGTYTFNGFTTVTGDGNPTNNSFLATSITNGTISTFPALQDFEAFTPIGGMAAGNAGWTGSTTGIIWEIEESTSGSTGTGPAVDHTLGTAAGNYVFLETSTGATGDVAELITPCVNLTGQTGMGMEFWYHMFGATIDTLKVDVFNGTAWVNNVLVIGGQQQNATTDAWKRAVINLSPYNGSVIKVRFRGKRGTNFTGDIAIDDVRFFQLPPVELALTGLTLPNSNCGLSATETICVTITNNGSTAATGFPVSYTLNGGTAVTETVTATIAPAATLQYCFTTKANLTAAGTVAVVGTVTATGDNDATNDTQTGSVITIPTITTYPYFQDFESGDGSWRATGTNSSWALGTPAKSVINSAASGTKAWVTNLTANHPNNEKSAVVGPCFNFSTLSNPTISMKIWWDTEDDWDGAVLQSSIDGGTTWQLVGDFGDPNNWYNRDSIDANPGNQPASANGRFVGWSGKGATGGSGGWVTASHALIGLGGQASVQLRVAFASDAATVENGVAFDDISISNLVAVPTITAAGPTTFCTGGSVVLTAATTTAGATFTWALNGTVIPNATGATYTATASGDYTAIATAGGTATSAATTVTVNAPVATPTITASGATAICAGSNVVLTAASATTGATYEWFLNGTLIPNATGTTFTASAAGAYTAVATAAGCASPASTATTVTVNPTPATPTITQNGGVLTSSSTTGNQWFLNGVAIPGATAQTYVTTANGNYTLVVTANGCPSAASAVKNVTNTGMGEALAGMHVDVYPNPASGSFNVKLSGYQQDAAVVLYNLAGQQITATKASAEGKASNISLKGLAAGTYLLKVTSEKGVQVTRLIVQ